MEEQWLEVPRVHQPAFCLQPSAFCLLPFAFKRGVSQASLAEPDANNPASQVGIYDVKSGSDRTSLDGQRYSDWD
ncbi:MAG: hypothetical protein ABI665_13345 [Vicinamibacterales bacterium]